jgi:hypothetical protein
MRHYQLLIITVGFWMIFQLAAPQVRAEAMTKGDPVASFTPPVKSGNYIWHPENSPAGPVVIIVSLPEQVLYVYRNGVRIGRTTISTGKSKHHTPTGVFTILQKNVKHTSTIFKGASMPFMERLTWGGVAMHAGNLPGYPASHGCVRLPFDFAQKLYAVTSDGTTVIITNTKSKSGSSSSPGMLFAANSDQVVQPGGVVWNPEHSPTGPVSIIISSADGAAYVYRNGVEIGRAPVGGLHGFRGVYVYSALANVDAEDRHEWFSTANVDGHAPNLKALAKHVSVDQQFIASSRALIMPGSTLILTDAPVGVSTRSGSGFNILTTAEMP